MTGVDILYFAGCPAYRRARLATLSVLRELGLDWKLTMILVRHERDAKDLAFHGSPTVRIDGMDIDPGAATRSPRVGLYSRTFAWDQRTWDSPPKDMLRAAFRERMEKR